MIDSAHKVNALEIVLSNFGIFMACLEYLAYADLQALKHNELVNWLF